MYWFLARRGIIGGSGSRAIGAIVLLIYSYAKADVLVVALISLALMAIAVAAARAALPIGHQPWMPETPVTGATRPFLVMNPHSGGGKVVKFDLAAKARALGADVALLDGPGYVDVAALVRDAVDRGADLLGVAGGDGTQALVAGIAAEHDLPFLVISAGTRNHFALDLGLDRNDPSTCLAALRDGVEVRVDLGMIGDRPFVNNASFGAYAQIVQSPEYRDHKEGTILSMLPDLLTEDGAALTVRVGNTSIDGRQAILVSNNPYGSGRLIDLGRRNTLDQGVLGVVAGRLATVGGCRRSAGSVDAPSGRDDRPRAVSRVRGRTRPDPLCLRFRTAAPAESTGAAADEDAAPVKPPPARRGRPRKAAAGCDFRCRRPGSVCTPRSTGR